MKIAVFGLGYVNLVTATSLSEVGHQVVGYDADAGKLESLRNSEVPFYEPGLADPGSKIRLPRKSPLSDHVYRAIADSEATLISLGSPQLLRQNTIEQYNYFPSHSYLRHALRTVLPHSPAGSQEQLCPGIGYSSFDA
ncbi:hypothetical protein [Ferrimicrobium acidiphilum]|jgi:UDPglucose 6-dehydrogenase|uniref:hypothetical protein n=1 Tax=Ferrimicrobium acidiphilum TaxID=121039 RepID=UPI003C6D97F2